MLQGMFFIEITWEDIYFYLIPYAGIQKVSVCNGIKYPGYGLLEYTVYNTRESRLWAFRVPEYLV